VLSNGRGTHFDERGTALAIRLPVRAALIALFAVACILALAAKALAADTRVSIGSPPGPFSQNKQNEPSVTVDPHQPNVLAAGANDNIDMEACDAGADNTCPFTDGVGVSGIYFSFDNGLTWRQPTYTGLTARNCLGVPGPDSGCEPTTGPIGTLPNYAEHDLVSDGDPAVAFGPRRRAAAAFPTPTARGCTTRT
jgi:hypothetical protein